MLITRKETGLFLLILINLILASCFNEKKITYFQKGINGSDTITIAKAYIPKIQSGDILSIYVNSLSTEASTFFNPYSGNTVPGDASASGGATPGLSQASSSGFLVDANGNVTIPLIGEINVRDLSITEAQTAIKKKLSTYLTDPTVSVRFLNYKISILGEVNKPGVYVIPNESTTIAEAITIAGDLTGFAKRNEVEIIRDNNGKKEFAQVDLTDRSIFTSPYYYLHANDIIYVKAGKSKVAQNDLALRLIPIAVSIITLLIVIIK
jgi:polysaccharide export outer membrane protein